MRLLSVILVCFMLAGCSGYHVHANAPSKQASMAYDTLLIADSVIKDTKLNLDAGRLPDAVIPALNTLVEAYNAGRASLGIYGDVLAAGTDPQTALTNLMTNITKIKSLISSLKGVK